MRPLRLCLFGAAGDTGNLGVSALLQATLGALARRAPDARVTAFDNGWGVRDAVARFASGDFRYRRCGARLSRRLHRPESYWNMRLASRLGGLGNPGARALLEADAVWDLSGGDSFADLYGPRVLEAVCAPKLLALERGVPLVLLPQTYGPFRSEEALLRARRIVRGAALAWARDERSFVTLRELAGPAFDPERQRLGVDVAFLLEPREPQRLPEAAAGWLDGDGPPLVGLNVSGLILNDPDAAERYGHRADYRALVGELLRRLLEESDARVLLVPHVLVPEDRVESDAAACRALAASLGTGAAGRVRVLDAVLDESETKWLLARLDWFCGTRMHACIGALSSGTPAASAAYSLKTAGVFETCDQGERVADLRELATEEALEVLWRAWEQRDDARASLAARLPAVFRQAETQMDVTLRASSAGLAGELSAAGGGS